MSLNKLAKKITHSPSFSKLSTITTKKLIQMNNVWASYDAKNYSLKEITLSIDRGTNYSIVGQSGSGKSTLLKLINGMMRPSKGQIKFDYQTPDMNNKQFRRAMSKIGYIPQSLGLVKNITVLENVLIGALPRIGKINSFLKKFPDNEIEDAEKIINLVGLKGKSQRKTYMLSGGEKRRVAIARALMQKPILLLADEIVSELDQVTAREIMDLVADAQKRLNLTAIMVHHDMQLALEYADRVAVIKEGQKILEIGIEGEKIIDFQSGNMTQQEIMELYNNES